MFHSFAGRDCSIPARQIDPGFVVLLPAFLLSAAHRCGRQLADCSISQRKYSTPRAGHNSAVARELK
jgi:hypothetical protein